MRSGYSLTGSVDEQVAIFLFGSGANGKSTFLRVLQDLLGRDFAIQAAHGMLMSSSNRAHPTEVADLFGVRVAVASETGVGESLDEALVKQLTGGDRIRARRMRQDFWEFEPTHKFWFATNHRPAIRGTDHGIWRRIIVVDFPVQIADVDQDRDLLRRLRCELPGILNWAVRGCLEWQHSGLAAPDEVRLAVQGYRSQSDPVGAFLQARCEFGPGYRAGATELFGAYAEWCRKTERQVGSQTEFGKRMTERGLERRKIGGNKVYIGARVQPARSIAGDGRGLSGPSSGMTEAVASLERVNVRNGPAVPSGPPSLSDGKSGGLARDVCEAVRDVEADPEARPSWPQRRDG